MKAVGYARVSSQEQIDGTSLRSQEDTIRAYASMRNLELVEVLIDAGVSGGTPLASRPEGARVASMVESGEVGAVIVTKLDRGFRSASDCLNCVESWERRAVSLHILNLGGQTIDTSSPTGKFFITVMAGAAELERNLINERCNEGRRARRQAGQRLGTVPFGWTLGPDGKTLVESPDEQRALALIREMKSQGHSLRAIARALNEHGYRAKNGGTWVVSSVQSVLRRAA